MNRSILKLLIAPIMTLLLGACGGKSVTEYHERQRDNVTDGTSLMESLDDKLPPIHSFAVPVMAGDTLVIQDFKSTDLVYTAYDIYKDKTIGRFGRFGNGPGEVANPLFLFYDKYSSTLYVGNSSRGKLVGFHLPEAVADTAYQAIDKLTMDFFKGILYPHVMDENTVLCTTYNNLSERVSRISRLDLNTGEITVIDSIASGMKPRGGIAVSEKDKMIYSADKQCDMIRILSLDGELRRIVYGPEYDDTPDDNDYFFSESEICGDKVASIYTGKKSKKERDKIILTDLEGRYLKTLLFDETIWGMAYHDKTGRLYLTTKGEPQIGYIELDKISD